MRAPRPVLIRPREIMMEMPISQIRELEKPLRASAMAPPGLALVTPVMATRAMATMDRAPMGMALPMIAAMVPMNRARRCQALGVTPWGTGMTNQISSVMAMATKAGTPFSDSFFMINSPSCYSDPAGKPEG